MSKVPLGLWRVILLGCAIHFTGSLIAAGAMLTSVN